MAIEFTYGGRTWRAGTKEEAVDLLKYLRKQDPADITTEDEATRAMAHVFEFAPLDFAGSQRQARVLAFEGLYPGHLVGAHGVRPLAPRGVRHDGSRGDGVRAAGGGDGCRRAA